jgi:sugar lactone lactonase YvrE
MSGIVLNFLGATYGSEVVFNYNMVGSSPEYSNSAIGLGFPTVGNEAIVAETASAAGTTLNDVWATWDGRYRYLIGAGSDLVARYDSTTGTNSGPWYWATDSNTGGTFSVAGQDTIPTGLCLSQDGLHMFITGDSNDRVYSYGLSTAWDHTSASYTTFLPLSSIGGVYNETAPEGVDINSDGTILTVVGRTNNRLFQWGLSTAYDLSSASYIGSLDLSTFSIIQPRGFRFSPNGDFGYLVNSGGTNGEINAFAFSTPFDLSTASNVWNFTAVTGSAGSGVAFSGDGTVSYVTQTTTTENYSSLHGAWDLVGVASTFRGGTMTDDGLYFLAVDTASDTVYSWQLGTAFDLSTVGTPATLSVTAQEATPTVARLYNNGTLLIVSGSTGDSLFAYALSTAYDITSASYTGTSFAHGEPLVTGLTRMNADGTIIMVSGSSLDDVRAFTMSTPYDVSTCSLSSSLDLSAVDTFVLACDLSLDGTKLYVAGSTLDNIYQYNLATPYDLSTASLDGKIGVYGTANTVGCQTMCAVWKPDGSGLIIFGNSTDDVISAIKWPGTDYGYSWYTSGP